MDNQERIIDAFKSSGDVLDAKMVSEITGIDKKEVSKEISKLKKEGKLISPKRCFYKIKDKKP